MHPTVRPSLIALAALALLVPTQIASADDAREPAARAQLLTKAGHGAAVVKALGDRLPAAAATNRMSASRLRAILESDPTAWIGPDGQMFYVEEAEEPPTVTAAESIPTASYPLSDTFALHSLPGSTKTIFLDFDGIYLSGTWWNTAKSMPAQQYSGFSLDADTATFSTAERSFIQTTWRIVAEKFAAFDVDVTTQDPGPGGYNRSGPSDQTYGDHVVITHNATAGQKTCGGGCGGVALLDTFDDTWRSDGYLEPAWVFSNKMSGSPVLTAHTVAHEVGHTFGLHHDGDLTHEYSSGHSNWFPLMGSSAKAVGQFSKGEYAGASNVLQDDLAVIAANGAPLRTDDHHNDLGTATPLGSSPARAVNGVISTRADRDVFAVTNECTDDLVATATGVGAGASLDLKVEVLGAGGNLLGWDNPTSGQNTSVWPALPTGMDASVSVPATPGTYYVRVDGVGKGNPVSDGYSDYASIGAYRLVVTGCDAPPPPITWTTPGTTTGATTTTRPPSAPRIGRASPGRRGGKVTATARWAAPTSTGGATVQGYRVKALRLDSSGRVLRVVASRLISATSRATTMRLAKGRYTFRVVAYNRVGKSPLSATSQVVRAR
jgi:hypothetical protein